MLVYLVGENENALVAGENVDEVLKLGAGIDASCRVRRRGQQQHSRFGRDGFFELFGSHLEIVFNARFHYDRDAVGQFYHLAVANPCRSRYDNLVAGVDGGQNGVAERLFGAVADNDVVGGEIHSGMASHI